MSDANTPPPEAAPTPPPARPDVEMVFEAFFGSGEPSTKENP